MFRNNSTADQRDTPLSDKKSGIISIVEKLAMGVLLCALLLGVHYSYKTLQTRYLTIKNSLDAGQSAIGRIAGIYGSTAPELKTSEISTGFDMSMSEAPLPVAEVNAAEMIIVVPEIERSAGEKKKAAKLVDKNKCATVVNREQCEHNKSECCTQKTEHKPSTPATMNIFQPKKKNENTRKSRQISDQKHFGVGLRFTV